MNDRELLELAAKAAGLKIDKSKTNGGGMHNTGFDINGAAVLDWHNNLTWSPLRDNGDAFWLAVKLRIDMTFYNGFQEVHAEPSNSDGLSPSDEKFGDDILSATRRAIVRAAAEIGRSMP